MKKSSPGVAALAGVLTVICTLIFVAMMLAGPAVRPPPWPPYNDRSYRMQVMAAPGPPITSWAAYDAEVQALCTAPTPEAFRALLVPALRRGEGEQLRTSVRIQCGDKLGEYALIEEEDGS